ncbi:aldo/keto reductase [Flavobacterium sp. N2038]|uniref:aldo/keto reductase n=1 Tax=Flavobacterium sp. N2038 TaxID=2986829 RepID=UPI002224F3AA|nr:aldo/keto reductase [Flavobacterium sp. N2038]
MNNKIILGTVQMGLDYGINNTTGKVSFENSCKILRKAFELGINTLDTAEAYGDAHKVIGDFHELNPDSIFNIITKIPHDDVESIENKINTYLKELNVNFLEVLMFHSFDSYLKNKNNIGILKKFKQEGIINHIGVSVYTNEQIEILLFDDNISVVQMPFNLLDNISLRGDLMHSLKKNGKLIHTRSAFLQGLFFKENFNDSIITKSLQSELIEIKNIAREENISISNLALSYCLNEELIDQVLIGVDSEKQLIDNLDAFNYKPTKTIIDKVNSLKVVDLDLLNPSLWK